jgi:acetyltransferase-like isoleucine patch superfamily enzyme
LKRLTLRLAGAQIGNDVRCVSSFRVAIGGKLTVKEGAWIGHEVLVVGGDAPVTLGAKCDIAPRVMFVGGSHEIDNRSPKAAGKGYSLPIEIGDGCWIGAGAIILGGTQLGDHCIVAAGAVVKGEFPAHSVIGGVPARVLRDVRED